MSNIMFAAVHTCLILVQLSGKRALSVHVFLFIPMRHIVRSLYLRRRPRSINAHYANAPAISHLETKSTQGRPAKNAIVKSEHRF
jgi:hypothetical protein